MENQTLLFSAIIFSVILVAFFTGYVVGLFTKPNKLNKRYGFLKSVTNKNRVFGSAPYYYYTRLEKDGKTKDFLFTYNDISGAEARAEDNPEDCHY